MKLQTRLRLWWRRFFIRRDEFHPSLNLDADAMMEMEPGEQDQYRLDLYRRRTIAHKRDLERKAADAAGGNG